MSRDDTQESDRVYFEVTPSTDVVASSTVPSSLARLHRIGNEATIECLLVADGDGGVGYYFGTDGPPTRLENLLRDLFPNAYSISRTEPNVDAVLGLDTILGAESAADQEAETDGDDHGDGTDETSSAATTERLPDGRACAAVEFFGRGDRYNDWQTPLMPFDPNSAAPLYPLGSIAEALATVDCPVAFQTLLSPKPDWSYLANDRIHQLEYRTDTLSGVLGGYLTGFPDEPVDAPRIDAIEEKAWERSFVCNVRAVAIGDDPERAVRRLDDAFTPIAGEYYDIAPLIQTDDAAATTADRLRSRELIEAPGVLGKLRERVPLTSNYRRGIVTDDSSLSHFLVIDGAQLGQGSRRALDTRPTERTGVPLPDDESLARYRQGGLTLGTPLNLDREPVGEPIAVPPELQPLHIAWFAKTGAGKTTALNTAIADNHEATDGADIVVAPKGDGMGEALCRLLYARDEPVKDFYYFECSEFLPAISFFDIEEQLATATDRNTVIQDVVDHYVEILVALMGADRYFSANRSPDVIRYILKAMYDPVHGADEFTHAEFEAAVRRMKETREAPPATDEDLARKLGSTAANSKRSFDEVIQGVEHRVEKATRNVRLRQLFNAAPVADNEFRFDDVLDEDTVVIVDTGGLRDESQRAITLVVLSKLWEALQRRGEPQATTSQAPDAARSDGGAAVDESDAATPGDRSSRSPTAPAEYDDDLPIVNLYLEEAADVAATDLVDTLLSKSRSFGLSVTLSMQYPRQLRRESVAAEDEALIDVSTTITGNVSVDENLARVLAGGDMDPAEVRDRMGALGRGEWLVNLPTDFGETEPGTFMLKSAPLPPGHPDGDQPLSTAEETSFQAQLELAKERTRQEYGIPATPADAPATTDEPTAERADADSGTATPDDAAAPGESADDASRDTADSGVRPLITALQLTDRMPDVVTYDEGAHAITCAGCGDRYEVSVTGMRRAIECCNSLSIVDRDDIPVIDCGMRLSTSERADSAYSSRQLAFLSVVHRAQHRQYDPDLEYDLARDSMVRLREYVGIDPGEVDDLVEDGLLRKDCDYPHRLYSVTSDGRHEISQPLREGVHYGPGLGDMGETSQHGMGVELGKRLIDHEYASDPDSEVVEAVSYHDLEDGRRLDAAGLDDDGDVVIALEAERINNDILEAVPKDYDKLADCDPEEAIWVTMGRDGGHEVLRALNDPNDNQQRVEKTYTGNTPPRQFKIDEPGLTQIYTVNNVQDILGY